MPSFSPFTPVGRSNHFVSIGSYQVPRYVPIYNNCQNSLCFTYNHNYVYNKNSAKGMVGTISSSRLASRKRL